MRRAQRLREGSDFRRVRRVGRSAADGYLVLYAAPGAGEATRVGISVSKRVGHAVIRNRVRRRVREVMRLVYPALGGPWDLVFVARAAAVGATFAELDDAVRGLLGRVGVLTVEQCSAQPKS